MSEVNLYCFPNKTTFDKFVRFATEFSGRKARRRGWKGLAQEMVEAGVV